MTQSKLPSSVGEGLSSHAEAKPSSLPAATDKPLNFGVIVFPTFQALDVFGPLDALNILSRSYEMNLSIISETLDPVSTAPHPDLQGVSSTTSNFAQRILPTHTFATAPPLDVLIVPGGLGTQLLSIASAVTFVQGVFPTLKYLITVCTGSAIAARAGVLDGRRATTNKFGWAQTTALRSKVEWVHRARWVQDGNVWTSSGVSAGLDVVFAWMRVVYGEGIARNVADRMEYTPVMDPEQDPFANRWAARRVSA